MAPGRNGVLAIGTAAAADARPTKPHPRVEVAWVPAESRSRALLASGAGMTLHAAAGFTLQPRRRLETMGFNLKRSCSEAHIGQTIGTSTMAKA
jgi:hypothetical protein